MELPVEVLTQLDITNLIAIAAMLWFFNSRLDKKFDKIDIRFDKMYEKLTDDDRRICRFEGAFSSKDCCRIRDEIQMR